jgi:hypothetical protein
MTQTAQITTNREKEREREKKRPIFMAPNQYQMHDGT